MKLSPAVLWGSAVWLASTCSAGNEASPVNPCPIKCSISGFNPLNWTYLHGLPALNRCPEPILFDTLLSTPLNDPEKHVTLRACVASDEDTTQEMEYDPVPFVFGAPERRSVDLAVDACLNGAKAQSNETNISFLKWSSGDESAAGPSDATLAISSIRKLLAKEQNCAKTIIFAKSGEAVVGLFVGAEIEKASASPLLDRFSKVFGDQGAGVDRLAAQNCKGQMPTNWSFGVVADLSGNITYVQSALAGWNKALCLDGSHEQELWGDVKIKLMKFTAEDDEDEAAYSSVEVVTSSLIPSNSTKLADRHLNKLDRRADCRAIQVDQGDGCYSLSVRCGISQTMLTRFNTATNFCDLLKPKQWVCCTAGDLPDFSPKPDANGVCHTYNIQPDDICFDIAEAHSLTVAKINSFNNQTWGWAGCSGIQPGQKICLSSGKPPMPAAISNAICGPQKPGTEPPTGDKKLEDLNPCPLKVCCNVWGQCGLDNDFCVPAPADTGAPGTSQPGKNGCISNCGMDIVNNDTPPTRFSHVAYFEAWNKERPCLHMDVTDIDTTKYSHIHFSFPDVTPNTFKIDVSKLQEQFDLMKTMSGIKRIVSLGGWAFSAEAPTYTIFREAVKPANRVTFANNVAAFVSEHNLEGIDFDWEYPGATDIPDIPSANPLEGQDYLEFLKLVRRRLPPAKTVSIAAPASYWYLKAFPIEEIAKVVDYIIYMTYDLHGQWDYGNKWSSPGCETGDCLRSHVNRTETMNALAMITKAGVPSNKVFVGVASYGRSFKMAQAGCRGPNCKFTGSREVSNAAKGMCTDTAGYISSAEIREILFNKDRTGAVKYHDEESMSDIIVYGGTEWVGWADGLTKYRRSLEYIDLNFGGISDWAVDLDVDYNAEGIGSGGGDDNTKGGSTCPLGREFEDFDSLDAATDITDECKVVLAIGILEKMLDKSLTMYEDVNNGYDDKFKTFARVMREAAISKLEKYMHWRRGEGLQFFDCTSKADGKTWSGRCSDMADNLPNMMLGYYYVDMTLRDEEGFYSAIMEEVGLTEDNVKFGPFEDETKCIPGTGGGCHGMDWYLRVTGMPLVTDDFKIPDPKEVVTEAKPHIDDFRSSIVANFFEIAAGIWEGGNADVIQVLSVPIFLLHQAVQSMDDAKDAGAEMQEQEKKNLILKIISALLFFVPFVGQFAAMAARMALLARMIAMAGLVGETAFAIHEIIENPENAVMAIMGLFSAGRIRTPKDFNLYGNARRSMTKKGSERMGPTFKAFDDKLQKLLGNCRKDGEDQDDNDLICTRDLPVLQQATAVDIDIRQLASAYDRELERRASKRKCDPDVHITTTTKTEKFLTTPAMKCPSQWWQACNHYRSVMSVHTNTPDMVRWTCWETDSSAAGYATSRWGRRGPPPNLAMPGYAQHHWDWVTEWVENHECEKDEWPPRYFWPKVSKGLDGQYVRLLRGDHNRKAGDVWSGFCADYGEFTTRKKVAGKFPNEKMYTTKSVSVEVIVKGGTTTSKSHVSVDIPRAVFEFKDWDGVPKAPDDGLRDNDCWPSTLLPDDPGFALLTNDPWYLRNPLAQASTHLYTLAPPHALTQGKTRSRVYSANRPIIAPRSLCADKERREEVGICKWPSTAADDDGYDEDENEDYHDEGGHDSAVLLENRGEDEDDVALGGENTLQVVVDRHGNEYYIDGHCGEEGCEGHYEPSMNLPDETEAFPTPVLEDEPGQPATPGPEVERAVQPTPDHASTCVRQW